MIQIKLHFPFTHSAGQRAELPSTTSRWRTFWPAQPPRLWNSGLGGGHQRLLDWQRKSSESDPRSSSLRNAEGTGPCPAHVPATPALSTLGLTQALPRSQRTSPTDYGERWLQEPAHLPAPLLLGEATTKLKASKTRAEMLCSLMAGRQSLPLSGAPETAARGRAPFRVAGWKLLLPLLALCLQLLSFLNRSLGLS